MCRHLCSRDSKWVLPACTSTAVQLDWDSSFCDTALL
jgi:hypothetical protein